MIQGVIGPLLHTRKIRGKIYALRQDRLTSNDLTSLVSTSPLYELAENDTPPLCMSRQACISDACPILGTNN
jgi:hypothetical protein